MDQDDKDKKNGDKTAEGSASTDQTAIVKKKGEGLGEWLQDTLADLQPYLQKLSEVRPVLLHRMDPEVAKKSLDNQREIEIRRIDADLVKYEQESKMLLAQQEVGLLHEREVARADRHEVRLIVVLVLVLVFGGGLALAFSYLGLPALANTVLTLVVSISSIVVNDLVRGRRQQRRLPPAQRKRLPGRDRVRQLPGPARQPGED